MSTAAWIALVFFAVAVVGSLSFLGVRAFRLWRTLRSFSRTAATAVDRVTQADAGAEERSSALTENQARLARATEHLQSSLAQLDVLRAAAAEAGATAERLRGVVPGK